MDNDFQSKAHELLLDLASKVEQILCKLGDIDPAVAESLGQEVAILMSRDWGGLNMYFPKGLSLEKHKLARRVWRDFTGNNAAELALRYKISLQWTYKIIRDMRAEESARRQPRLFEDDPEDDEDGGAPSPAKPEQIL